MWYLCLTSSYVEHHLYARVNPTWSWCIIFLICKNPQQKTTILNSTAHKKVSWLILHVNRMKRGKKTHDAQKAFEKFTSHNKNTKKTRDLGNMSQYLWAFMNPTANILLNVERLKGFSHKIRNKTRLPTFITFTQHFTGSSSQNN